ncbi:hypothetical protein [endosymbiont of Ridgeia piscesae]|jgi:hypothetical protein|uniref:Uncharacterized protein n=1 Tax=endosymbiont of Ridgeia piscesae TaxID=54398 RepID=A0A0T5YWL6_9GAMM|nr:hypothetical protein [endosymbiont of Ridgeia piscesae]KRT55035.1 hypothetical protein Ga0074115_1137 [endosymbiont of Ridgeia piscesae]KRT59702.1 hypothetical protein Ga0076813_15947 [endosymbiont of Ridgeia piscesae]
MKNSVFILILMLLVTSASVHASDEIRASDYGHVTSVIVMGQLWQNPNRGGFFFYTDNQPAEISYFIVRGNTETYINRLLATLLSAKSMNQKVAINYRPTSIPDPNTGLFEGEVVSVSIK